MEDDETTKLANGKKNAPVHEVRYGAVKAVIWANATKNGTMHNVTLVRVYVAEGQWRESGSLSRDDLLVAGKALDSAHTWICDQERSARMAAPEDAA
jgi:hypothetical protein